LAAQGCLQPGWSGQWSDPTFGVYSVSLHTEADRLLLSWRRSPVVGEGEGGEGEGGDVVEIVPLDRRPMHLGGSRTYFICPGSGTVSDTGSCGRRVAALYFVHGYFLCRHCHRLVHACKYDHQPWQRLFRRAGKLKQRFGIAGPAEASPLPAHHQGVPAEVYARRLEEALLAEIQASEACTLWLQAFAARVEEHCLARELRRFQFTL
jgi:hypothetical protein